MKNAEKVVKNLITGMLGVGLYMAASWLLFAYGEGNSHNGLIESNWAKMPIIRFRLAILITALAAPLFLIGVQGAVRAINTARRKRYPVDFYMAKLFVMGAYASAISMLFNMAVSVMLPVLYRELFNTRLMGAEIISTVESVFYYVSIPFYVYYWVGIVGVSVGFMYFVMIGRLLIPRMMMIFTPLFFVVLEIALRTFENSLVDDIFAASDGIGYLFMFGLLISFVAKIPRRSRRRVSDRGEERSRNRYERNMRNRQRER